MRLKSEYKYELDCMSMTMNLSMVLTFIIIIRPGLESKLLESEG